MSRRLFAISVLVCLVLHGGLQNGITEATTVTPSSTPSTTITTTPQPSPTTQSTTKTTTVSSLISTTTPPPSTTTTATTTLPTTVSTAEATTSTNVSTSLPTGHIEQGNCINNTCEHGATCVANENNYTCSCAAGYIGAKCEIDINECVNNTCQNGANCTDGVNSYTCTCKVGYTGKDCETNVNDCVNITCANGGSCLDAVNSYTCTCVEGYTGSTCETNINDCINNTCQNGGTCVDGVNTFTCNCSAGFTGSKCETNKTSVETSSTSSSPQTSSLLTANTTVSGQSSTTHSIDGSTTTKTSHSETSTTAPTSTVSLDITTASSSTENTTSTNSVTATPESSTKNVSTNTETSPISHVSLTSIEQFSTTIPTQNSSTEVVVSSSSPSILTSSTTINTETPPNSTFVSSPSSSLNSSGINVTSAVSMTTKSTSSKESTTGSEPGSTTSPGDINDCVNITCEHGGTCVDGVNSYTCRCVDGYTGEKCETNINDCVNHTCQNGGSCVDGVHTYTCNCSAGFTGRECETNINDCVNITCQNGGTCVDGVNTYTCNCSAGFTGSKCETNINDCVNVTCQNGGSCVDGVNTYTCNCIAGFTGSKCETNINDCVNVTCQNGGSCVDGVNTYTCNCSAGFTGSKCETYINDCVNNTCQNGATCVDGVNTYTCNCSAGFTGSKCETNIDDCVKNSCQNGGTCVDGVSNYTCSCSAGFTGSKCETNINECVVMNVECENNGTCEDGVNNYTCLCQTGWEGRHCEKDIDECTTKTHKCHINAICANNNGSYNCTCRPGFTGDGWSCRDINECDNKTLCANGASCVNTPGSFQCFCQDRWTGQYCYEDIDECKTSNSVCATDADCTNTDGGFNCTCRTGFRGDGIKKCVQEVLISVETGEIHAGDDDVFGPFTLQENLCYNGKQYNSFYVSMNGYITFGSPVYQRYPPENPEQWKSFKVPVVAPLWSNIVTSGQNSGLRVSIVNDNATLTKIGTAFNTTNLRFSIVCTWKKAVPYPFEQNAGYEFADFQAIIAVAKDGSETKIMFNYDKEFFTWKKASDKKVAIGMSNADFSGLVLLNSSNFTSVCQGNKHDNSSRWMLEVPSASCKSEFECLDALASLTTSRISAMSDVDPCPCSLLQARRDRKFRLINDNTENVLKFVSRFEKGSLKARQRCHYSSAGSLLKGQPNGGYIDFDSVNATYDKCCIQISKCNLFYASNPSDQCGAYIAPAMALSWGDPHIITLDGATYTFNGRGEYTLVKVNHSNIYIDVQVRTENVNNNPDATNFVGLAAQDDTGSKIEIILHQDNESATIYKNGTWKAAFPTSNDIDFDVGHLTVFKQNDETLTVAFLSGMSIDVTVGSMLDIVTSAPAATSSYGGHTVGLLGNNNGNSSDDFRPRNDLNKPLSASSSESDIFSSFGQTWMVNETESLFSYNVSGGNYTYYNNRSINPTRFLGDINTTSIQQYINETCKGKLVNVTTCGENKACIVDAIATCNINVGESSQKTNETAIEDRKLIGHMPPKFDLPDELNIWYDLNKTVTLIINVNATVEYNASIEKNAYDGNNSFFIWNVSENMRNTSVYLKIVATDSLNASSEYWPRIVYCGCQESSQCDLSLIDEDGPVDDHFYRARCRCPQNFTGDFCQIHVKEPCFGNSSRINGKCKCPEGLTGDGIRCYDVNECYTNVSKCTQLCTNTEGSYTCGCNPGWTLNIDNHTCDDVDECDNKTTPCKSETEYCINTIGSYKCSCLPGYTEDNGTCINVKDQKFTYAGVLVYKTTETNKTKLKEAVNIVLTAIFKHSVTVIDVTKASERFKRDLATGTKYQSNFLVFFNSPQSTVELNSKFTLYIVDKGLTNDSYFYAENASIPLFISTTEFQMKSEDEGGICGTPSVVTCDPISTNCSAINGGYQCKCKNGFDGWETPYISCKDVDECLSAKEKCVGGVRCENTPGSFVCHCPNGHKYDGRNTCIDMCDSIPCKHGGQCIHGTSEGQYVCKCDDKWTGPTCEDENSEAQKLKTIAIAVGASLGAVCLILFFALLGMYRRHKNKYSGYSRRPLSAYDFDSTMNFGQSELRTKDFPIDDENSTSFSIPRPQIVNENKYQLAESVKTYDNAAEGDTGKMEEPKQPLTKQSEKAPANGAENPSFLHSPALEGDRKSSKRQSKNPYEYF